jgi:hypothetical protein
MRVIESLDHPIPFIIAITLAVLGVKALGKWAFTRLGWDGPKAFFS